MTNKSIIERMKAAQRERDQIPPSKQWADMIARGVIDEEGRVLKRIYPEGKEHLMTFDDLCLRFPLRPIRTEGEYNQAESLVYQLEDRDDINSDESIYLELLIVLVDIYADEHIERPRPETVPLELAGKWIGWSSDCLRIVAWGNTTWEAIDTAREAGEPNPVAGHIPRRGELRPVCNIESPKREIPDLNEWLTSMPMSRKIDLLVEADSMTAEQGERAKAKLIEGEHQ